MKKKLIALAVAGAMTIPMAAMAEVQISGGLQTQLVSLGGSDQTDKGLHMMSGGQTAGDGMTWGAVNFSASHDLGNGMKALVKYGFNVQSGGDNTGQAGLSTRDAYVGLAGGFGAVLAGRMSHPYKTATVSWDPFVATFMQARGNGGMGGAAAGALYGTESSNALAYANTFGSVKVVAAVLVDEGKDPNDATKTAGNHGMAISVNIPVGPMEIALAHADLSEMRYVSNNQTAFGKDTAASKVGVKYNAGDLTVAAQYEMLDKAIGDGNAMFVTASYKMGANTISASIGQEDKELRGAADSGSYMAVGVTHSMSKKARVFAGYRASELNAAKTNSVGAGLRVSF